jgi:very-short-patch-repair endonuclease
MNFDKAHNEFIDRHLQQRTGERRGRLERGHREAEILFCRNIWWALRGNFDGLHPEYEVIDWRGQSYFCDFVWISRAVRLIIEIKGFGPHVRDMDRQKYSRELNRETFLTAMGFQVISFSYDDVAYNPDLCITLLRMVLGRYQAEESEIAIESVTEREIIRLACRLARPIRPIDLVQYLLINRRTAIRKLQSLCAKGLLTAESGVSNQRIVRYSLHPQALKNL